MLDVIDGLQFVVDHKDDYNIRVVNLSLQLDGRRVLQDRPARRGGRAGLVHAASSSSPPPATRARTRDAVDYAPANDPYVITVGGVDDAGTKHDRRRHARPLVEPRHDPGRLREARPARARRARWSRRWRPAPTTRRSARPAWSTAATSGSAAPRWPRAVSGEAALLIQAPRLDPEPGQGHARQAHPRRSRRP